MKETDRYCIQCLKKMDYWEPAWAWICSSKHCLFRGLHQQGVEKKALPHINTARVDERSIKRHKIIEMRKQGYSFNKIKEELGFKHVNSVSQMLKTAKKYNEI